MKDVAAIIPALNEAASIAPVLRAVAAHAQPIVVDDGSVDGTGMLAWQHGALVVTHAHNQGYGAALASGLQAARQRGFRYAITLDADGQHDPALIQSFLLALRQGAPLVVGVRDRLQRPAEHVFAWVGRRLWGLRDPLCGLKAYDLQLLDVLGPFDALHSVGTEWAVRLVRAGLPVAEIPVHTRPRVGSSRFGSGLRANLRLLGALLRVLHKAWPLPMPRGSA